MAGEFDIVSSPIVGLPHRRWLGVLLLLSIVGCAWLLCNPPGARPDDTFHFSNVWCPEGVSGIPCEPRPEGDRLVPNSFVEGSPWWEATGQASAIGRDGKYPDLQYSVMRLFASDDVYQSVVIMRFVNLLLALLMICAAFVLVGKEGRLSISLTWLIVPMAHGYFLVASNHPMSWYLVGAGTLWAFIYAFFNGASLQQRLWSALFAVIAAVMTIGSRPEGRLVTVLVVAASTIVAVSARYEFNFGGLVRGKLGRKSLVVGSLGLLVGLAMAFVLLRQEFTARVLQDSLGRLGSLRDLLDTPEIFFHAVAVSVGSFEAPVTGLNSVPAGVAVAACMVIGVRKMWTGKGLSVLLVTGAMIVAPQMVIVDERGAVFSPSRYFVVFMLIFLGLLLLMPKDSPNPRLSRGEMILIWLAATLAHSLSLHSVLGPNGAINRDAWELNLNQNLKWWWSLGPSPMTIWFLGSVSFSLAVFIVLGEYSDRPEQRSNKWTSLVVGILLTSMVPLVVVLERNFYRPPQSERPAINLSRPVEWKFSFTVSSPQEVVEMSSGQKSVSFRVVDAVVGRSTKGETAPPVSIGFLSDSWVDVSPGIKNVRIARSDGEQRMFSSNDLWTAITLAKQSSGFVLFMPSELLGAVPELTQFVGVDIVRLELLVEIPQCPPRESILRCPFSDFAGADLSRDDFERADLRGADLRGVNFTEAKLNGTNLSGAILDDVDFTRAYMVGVDLSETSQSGVKLEGVIWTR